MVELFMNHNRDKAPNKVSQAHLDRTAFRLDYKQWQHFMATLEAPDQSSEALCKLLATKAPWER